MGAQPPLVLVVSGCGCFCKCHKSPSSEKFPTAPHTPVRRRSTGSCAPIDRLHSAYGSWVFVSTSLVQEPLFRGVPSWTSEFPAVAGDAGGKRTFSDFRH